MSNTRETISLKTIIMTQNMTKEKEKEKEKEKTRVMLSFLCLSPLSSLSLRSWKTNAKKKKKKKSEEKRRAILVSV